jgi:hypothetical protein
MQRCMVCNCWQHRVADATTNAVTESLAYGAIVSVAELSAAHTLAAAVPAGVAA